MAPTVIARGHTLMRNRSQEMAVAKVLKKNAEGNTSVNKLFN